jgi:hypothetical protein
LFFKLNVPCFGSIDFTGTFEFVHARFPYGAFNLKNTFTLSSFVPSCQICQTWTIASPAPRCPVISCVPPAVSPHCPDLLAPPCSRCYDPPCLLQMPAAAAPDTAPPAPDWSPAQRPLLQIPPSPARPAQSALDTAQPCPPSAHCSKYRTALSAQRLLL